MIDSLIKNYIQDKMDDVIGDKFWDAASGISDIILGGISKNAGKQDQAEQFLGTLDRHDEDHIWDVDKDESNKILGHIFWDGLPNVIKQTAQKFDIDIPSASELFIKIAPVVLGMLGKEKKEKGFNLDMLTDLLGNESNRVRNESPIKSMISDFIDSDDDGSIADDLFAMGKKFLS